MQDGAWRDRIRRAVGWTLARDGAMHALRLATSITLTHLLLPQHFGILVPANILLQGLQMFADIGLGPAIIYSPRGDDPRFLRTAWSIQAVRGAILWAAAAAVGWPLATAYGRPELAWLLPVMGLTALIGGFGSMRLLVAERHLRVARLAGVRLGSAVAGAAVTIVLAWTTGSVWALAAGGVVTETVRCVLSHTVLPGPADRWEWDGAAARELIRFGFWILLNTLTTFLATKVDAMIFAKLFPLALVGVFSQAANMSRLAIEVFMSLNSSVAIPAYARAAEKPGELAALFRDLRARLLLLAGLGVSGLVLLGPAVVEICYAREFHGAGWMLQILAAATWFNVLESSNAALLLAVGRPRFIAFGNAAKLAGLAVFLPLFTLAGGVPGFLLGMAAAEVPKYLLVAFAARTRQLPGWGLDLGMTAGVLLCAAAALALARGIQPAPGMAVRVLLGLGAFLAVWALPAWRILRGGGSEGRPAGALGSGAAAR